MKKIWSALLLLLSGSVFAQKTDSAYTITGHFNSIKSGTVYLYTYSETGYQKDSSAIADGNFTFTGFSADPKDAVLNIKDHKGNLRFYVEAGHLKITGDGNPVNEMQVTGSSINDDDKALALMMKEVQAIEDAFMKVYQEAYKAKNDAVLDSLDETETEMMMAKRKVVGEFVKAKPNSLRAVMAIQQNFGYYAEASEVEPLYNLLSKDMKQSAAGQKLNKMLDTYKRIAVGEIAPDINQKDTSGNSRSLSSLRGKYVLIDFWASWCGPCRKENPNLVKAYNQFSKKGFEILGVSYDDAKGEAKWKKAVVDDKLTWYQVSELNGWSNITSDQYYIKAIPSNILVDKNGRIIAKNLFGKKLTEKLAEIMP